MTVAINIVLADAQATPVNHTFVPVGRDAQRTFWYEDRSFSNDVGFWRISVKTKRPPMSNGVANGSYSYEIGLHEPILETLSNNSAGLTPAPTVAYTTRAIVVFYKPTRSTLQNRKDIRKMMAALLTEATMVDLVENNNELTS